MSSPTRSPTVFAPSTAALAAPIAWSATPVATRFTRSTGVGRAERLPLDDLRVPALFRAAPLLAVEERPVVDLRTALFARGPPERHIAVVPPLRAEDDLLPDDLLPDDLLPDDLLPDLLLEVF